MWSCYTYKSFRSLSDYCMCSILRARYKFLYKQCYYTKVTCKVISHTKSLLLFVVSGPSFRKHVSSSTSISPTMIFDGFLILLILLCFSSNIFYLFVPHSSASKNLQCWIAVSLLFYSTSRVFLNQQLITYWATDYIFFGFWNKINIFIFTRPVTKFKQIFYKCIGTFMQSNMVL